MVEVTKICECCEETFTREVGSNEKRSKFCSKNCMWKNKRLLAYDISFKAMRQAIKYLEH